MILINSSRISNEIGNPIMIATHPRSGTHLTLDLLRKQFKECQSWLWFGETLHNSYLNLDHLSPDSSPHINQKKAIALLRRCKRPLLKTHCLPNFQEIRKENINFVLTLKEKADIYYVVRDGRDVICSVHSWQQCFNPRARCSFSEFLRQRKDGLSYPKKWAHHVSNWLKYPQIQVLRFEKIVSNTSEVLNLICNKSQIKPMYIYPLLPERKKTGNRWEDYYLRLTRQLNSTTIVGRYKNQKPSRWQEVFTFEDRKFFFMKKQVKF
jgi:hypothetical protein